MFALARGTHHVVCGYRFTFLRRPTAPENRSGGAQLLVARLLAGEIIGFCALRRRGYEVGERVGATQLNGGVVVHNGGFLGSVVGAQPEPDAARRVPYLRRPLPPRPLPHSTELPRPRPPPEHRGAAGPHLSFPGNNFNAGAVDGNVVDEAFDPTARGGHGGLVLVAGGVRGVGVGDAYSDEFGIVVVLQKGVFLDDEVGAVKVLCVLYGRRSHKSIEG